MREVARFFIGTDVSNWKGTNGESAFQSIDFVSLALRLIGLVPASFNPTGGEGLAALLKIFNQGENISIGQIAVYKNGIFDFFSIMTEYAGGIVGVWNGMIQIISPIPFKPFALPWFTFYPWAPIY